MKICGICINAEQLQIMLSIQSLQDHIPYYLTKDAKAGLIKALKDFPNNLNYYTNFYPQDVLQGDGWRSLPIIRFENGSKDYVMGILLSNSCDMDTNNQRDIPPSITFAPIVGLNDFVKLLHSTKISKDKIENKILAIKEQKITSIFYLPENESLGEDCLALLSDLHTVPLTVFTANKEKLKLFTLSQIGFYLFLFKLSVHFCRFHENVAR